MTRMQHTDDTDAAHRCSTQIQHTCMRARTHTRARTQHTTRTHTFVFWLAVERMLEVFVALVHLFIIFVPKVNQKTVDSQASVDSVDDFFDEDGNFRN